MGFADGAGRGRHRYREGTPQGRPPQHTTFPSPVLTADLKLGSFRNTPGKKTSCSPGAQQKEREAKNSPGWRSCQRAAGTAPNQRERCVKKQRSGVSTFRTDYLGSPPHGSPLKAFPSSPDPPTGCTNAAPARLPHAAALAAGEPKVRVKPRRSRKPRGFPRVVLLVDLRRGCGSVPAARPHTAPSRPVPSRGRSPPSGPPAHRRVQTLRFLPAALRQRRREPQPAGSRPARSPSSAAALPGAALPTPGRRRPRAPLPGVAFA